MTRCRSISWMKYSLLCLTPLVVGCGDSFSVPAVDPAAAVDAAFAQNDKNGDGNLDEEELAGTPGLLAERGEYDMSGDKAISKQEMLDRLSLMYERNVPFSQANATVTLDGKPLEGATVRYIPESYLGEGTTLTAEGMTDESGIAALSIPADKLPEDANGRPLMQPGLYRV